MEMSTYNGFGLSEVDQIVSLNNRRTVKRIYREFGLVPAIRVFVKYYGLINAEKILKISMSYIHFICKKQKEPSEQTLAKLERNFIEWINSVE